MTPEREDRDERGEVVELTFDLAGSDLFLVAASEEASCRMRVAEILGRGDGSAVEFVVVRDAAPETVLELAAETERIREARLLEDRDGEALFEFVSESDIAAALAAHESTYTDITATAGEGRVTVEVPAHADPGAVVRGVLEEFPEAELVARRTTDRSVPTLTDGQYRDRLVGDLTDRQLEALRLAHARDYFGWPRGAAAEDLAAELDVTTPTFSQHLRVAHRKVLDRLFDP